MVLINMPSRRSSTANASRPRRGTTAVAPRVATLTGSTSEAPRGTVETWLGDVTGIRLSVAAVVFRTTTISSGGGKGAEVSAHPAHTKHASATNRVWRKAIL